MAVLELRHLISSRRRLWYTGRNHPGWNKQANIPRNIDPSLFKLCRDASHLPFYGFDQQCRSRVSLYWVVTNSFAACFSVCCDTVGFYHCVLGKSLLWLFLLGSCPFRCLLCCPLDGETQIWLGDLRLAFRFCLVCGLVVMTCHVLCDHLCPC